MTPVLKTTVPLTWIRHYSFEDCVIIMADESCSSSASFESTFRPYIITLKCLAGIQLNRIGNVSIRLAVYGTLLMLANLAVSSVYSVEFTLSLLAAVRSMTSEEFRSYTTATLLSSLLDAINKVSFVLGVHFCFFVVSLTSNLKGLWSSLLKIDEQLNLPIITYKRIQRIVWIGVILFILVYFFS